MTSSILNTGRCTFTILISLTLTIVTSMELFNVKFFEQKDSKLVATSNYNYAISSPKLLSKNWRAVSVNGDDILVVTTIGEKIIMNKTQFGDANKLLVETLRDEISNSNSGGYMHISSGGSGSLGGSNFMMSSNSGGGSTSSSFSSAANQFSSFSGGQDNSVNMKDDDNFSVARSDLPFNWSRVFFNGDMVTFVFRNGDVHMLTLNSVDPVQAEALTKLKKEVKEMQLAQGQQFSNTMRHSLDMVSNIFNNIMGKFPKPPDFQSSVGNMFGNNFPFGSNNSPFSGWPFSGTGAFAYAGRR